MSRRPREEMPFGSDSFLDVLANIVGILIILIVAAAARMGRIPDLSLLTKGPVEPAKSDSTDPPAEPEEPVIIAAPEPDEPPAEISDEMQAISGYLAALNDKALAADARLKKLQSASGAAQQALTDEEAGAARRNEQVRQAQLRIGRSAGVDFGATFDGLA